MPISLERTTNTHGSISKQNRSSITNSNYERLLNSFLKTAVSLGHPRIVILVGFFIFLPKELAPLDDRSFIRISATAPEGSSYEYMTNFMDQLTKYVIDSVPEKRIAHSYCTIVLRHGAVNTGFARLGLFLLRNANDRSFRSLIICRRITKLTMRVFLHFSSKPSRWVSGRFARTVWLSGTQFDKLKEAVPKFMRQPLPTQYSEPM
jgi:multidrug efflux pump subunit AcrB